MKEYENRCLELMEKVSKKEKLTYDEFIEIIGYGLEMQFYYNKRKFGVTHFDGYEFYEWNIEEGYQSYKTIEEFANNIHIEENLVKNIWNKITKINFAD